MANQIERMLPRHYEILNLTLGGNGPKEIAQALEMTPQAISGIVNSPLFQDELARRRIGIENEIDSQLARAPSLAKNMMEAASAKAAGVHINLLDHADARIQQKSASEILDRVLGINQKNTQPIMLEKGAIQILMISLEESKKARETLLQTKEVA